MQTQLSKKLHHRSRERIDTHGEVFTPEPYVNQMLDVFDKRLWSDEEAIFFEPTAGHGNIVLPIVNKRFQALHHKYSKKNVKSPELQALTVTIRNLWAIDICSDNIQHLRERVLEYSVNTIAKNQNIRLETVTEYLPHLLCSIIWQIHENEALSALATPKNAKLEASKTIVGCHWYNENGHFPINFQDDWCSHFTGPNRTKKAEQLFLQAERLVQSILFGPKSRVSRDLAFAQDTLKRLPLLIEETRSRSD